jgi:hypothetical protein
VKGLNMLYRYVKFKKHPNYDTIWNVDHIGYSSKLTYDTKVTGIKPNEDYSTYILNIDKGYLDILDDKGRSIYDNDLIKTQNGEIYIVKHKKNRKTPIFINVMNSKIKHSTLYFDNISWELMGNAYNFDMFESLIK